MTATWEPSGDRGSASAASLPPETVAALAGLDQAGAAILERIATATAREYPASTEDRAITVVSDGRPALLRVEIDWRAVADASAAGLGAALVDLINVALAEAAAGTAAALGAA